MEMKPNKADEAAAKLRAIIGEYAPDYTAPALTNLLVEEARKIGLPLETVQENIAMLWSLHEDPVL